MRSYQGAFLLPLLLPPPNETCSICLTGELSSAWVFFHTGSAPAEPAWYIARGNSYGQELKGSEWWEMVRSTLTYSCSRRSHIS